MLTRPSILWIYRINLESDDMTEFEYIQYEVSVPIALGAPRRYKQYTRNRKVFWRDYNRDVEGGSTINDLMRIRMENAKKEMQKSMGVNAYMLGIPSNNTETDNG